MKQLQSTHDYQHSIRFVLILILAVLVITLNETCCNPIVVTVVGGGACDGEDALLASLNLPTNAVENSLGELFITEGDIFPRVRKVDVNGKISTIIGNGVSGYNGEGIDGTKAMLSRAYDVKLDSKGLLYVSDSLNNRVIKLLANGSIVRAAGYDQYQYDANGLTFDGDGLATIHSLNYPNSIAISSLNDDLLITDQFNHLIRLVSNSTGMMKTVAGDTSIFNFNDNVLATVSSVDSPIGCAFTPSGELLFTDNGSINRIRKIDSAGMVSTIIGSADYMDFNGDGDVSTTHINNPSAVVMDSNGIIYFADTANNRIRKIGTDNIVTTLAGSDSVTFNGKYMLAKDANLNSPFGVSIGRNGDLIVSDTNNGLIRRILSNGTIIPIAGSGFNSYCVIGNGKNPLNVDIVAPAGLHFDINGDILISDGKLRRLLKLSVKTGILTEIAGRVVTDPIAQIPENGGDYLLANETSLTGITGITGDLEGNIYIAETNNHVIRKIFKNGTMIIVAGIPDNPGFTADGIDGRMAQLQQPRNPKFDQTTGDLYFISASRIQKLFANGTITTVIGTELSGDSPDGTNAKSARIFPVGLALGKNSEIYFGHNGCKIRKMNTNGTIVTIVGLASDGFPYFRGIDDIAADTNGDIYVTDNDSASIFKVFINNGTVVKIAGIGTNGFNGDNLDPINTQLSRPYALAVNPKTGDLLFTDIDNHRVRMITTTRQCNGTLASDSMVCSGHGVCYMENDCTCNSGYIGEWCEYSICNGTFANESSVCNGHGVCSGPDICNCTFGYSGTFCEIAPQIILPRRTCYGIDFNETLVCSGNGECSSVDNCTCYNGWFGSNCSMTMCFDVFSDQLPCNGHGNCSSFNNCTCDNNWIGLNCSIYNSQIIPTTNDSTINSTTIDNSTIIAANSSSIDNSTSVNNTIIANSTFVNNTSIDNSTITNSNTILSNISSIDNSTFTNNSTNNSIDNSTIAVNSSSVDNTTFINNSTIDNSTITNSTILSNVSSIDNSTFANSTNNSSAITTNTLLNNSTIDNSTNIYNSTILSNDTGAGNSTINNSTIDINNSTFISNNTSLSNSSTVDNSTNSSFTNNSTINNSNITMNSTNSTMNDSSTIISNNTIIGNNSEITNSTISINITFSNSSVSLNSSVFENSTTINNSTIDANSSSIDNSTFVNNTSIDNSTITNSSTILSNISSIDNSTFTNNSTGILPNNTIINNETIHSNSTIFNNSTNQTIIDNSTNIEFKCLGVSAGDTSAVCGGQGICISLDKCQCHSNEIDGYWTGKDCSLCASSYSGDNCKVIEKQVNCLNCNSTNYALFALFSIPVLILIIILILFFVLYKRRQKKKNYETDIHDTDVISINYEV